MSWPSLHALLNHFPIVLTVIGALAVLLGAMHERRAIWMYALSTLTLAGLTIYPAWLTGEQADEAVRHAWYIAPGVIRTHSAAADITLWIVGVTGLLALIALITLTRTREALSPARGFRVLVGLGALASFSAIAYTGYLGGKVVIESSILASPTPPIITVPLPTTSPVPAQSGQPLLPSGALPSPSSTTQPVPPVPKPAVPQIAVPQTATPRTP